MYDMLHKLVAAVIIVVVPSAHIFAADEDTFDPIQQNNPGLAELDKATETRVTADSMSDLQNIVRLCESALKIGLDEENADYAKQLLTSALYEHASRLCGPVFEGRGPLRLRKQMRAKALNDLERLLGHDDSVGAVYILVARLHLLAGGDREKAVDAVENAIKQLQDVKNKQQLSEAYALRSRLAENPQNQIAELDKAIEIDSDNLEAYRDRGLIHLTQNKFSEAIADFKHIIAKDPGNILALKGMGEALSGNKEYDKALEHLGRAIEAQPDSFTSYLLRAKVLAKAEKTNQALEDLNESIKLEPRNIPGLLARAQLRGLRGQEDDYTLAIGDLNRVLELSPQLREAILLRAYIHDSSGKMGEAIADVRQLLHQDPDSVGLQLQLADFYDRDKRPRKAITLYDQVLASDPENLLALRRRADSLLNIGEQAEAIAAYEAALTHVPDDSGILNNCAWVLATSPDDTLRNGKRSLELAKKACEVTDYKEPHILSTLAAAYAELGDFPTAKKWSSKAVEMGPDKMKELLRKELASYEQSKPWRELKDVKEKGPNVEPPSNGDLNGE